MFGFDKFQFEILLYVLNNSTAVFIGFQHKFQLQMPMGIYRDSRVRHGVRKPETAGGFVRCSGILIIRNSNKIVDNFYP